LELPIIVASAIGCPVIPCMSMCASVVNMKILSVSEIMMYKLEVEIM
jgi:hypothetical protein